jgi:hypothetical protein
LDSRENRHDCYQPIACQNYLKVRKSGSGGRAGSGAGGSIYIKAGHMTGTGILSVKGGDVTGSSTCLGGGGAGGRIAIHYSNNTYTGKTDAFGGKGYECGATTPPPLPPVYDP